MANTHTHSVGVTYHTDSGTITNTTDSYTADTDIEHTATYNAGSVNSEIDVAVTVANVKSLVLFADAAMTLKTNSATVPGTTLVLAASKQVVWNTDSLNSNPFTTNVTKIFASCTATAVLKMRFLVDQTP